MRAASTRRMRGVVQASTRKMRGVAVAGWRRLKSETSSRDVEWPKPLSPEWLALQKRPFFGIPADEAAPVRSPVEEGWLEKKERLRAEERAREKAREKAAERAFDAIQRSNGATLSPPEDVAARLRSGAPSSFARPHPLARPPPSPRLEKMRAFDMRPLDIKRALDAKVVGQDAAKRAIAVAVAEHYGHARRCLEDPERFKGRTWHKKNLLLLGPSGCGKTQLCRALAEIVDAAYVKADATKFSATGYVGRDVDDVIAQLVDAAGEDREAAEVGVVHVDEIDKVCERPGGLLGAAASVNTRDVQTSLLKLMEDAEMTVGAKGPAPARAGGAKAPAASTFSTKFVLWIFSGAFVPLLDKLEADGETTPTAQDLVESGLIHEFVGRVPVRCALDPLSADDLVAILSADNDMSPLRQQKDYFDTYDIDLTVDDEALEAIAERALAHGLGARALVSELDAVLRDAAFHLPSAQTDRLHLDRAFVDDPAAALDRVLQSAGVFRDS